MRRAYAIGALNNIEDTLKVHMYCLNVQGLRVKAFVVCCFLFVVCCLMFVDYRNFLSLKFHWALLACLRWSFGTLGLLWVPLDGHWGSICHIWGSIGAPLGHHWGPFVAFGAPLGCLWGSLGVTLRSLWAQFFILTQFEHFYSFGDFLKKKRAMKRPRCELDCIFVGPNGGL